MDSLSKMIYRKTSENMPIVHSRFVIVFEFCLFKISIQLYLESPKRFCQNINSALSFNILCMNCLMNYRVTTPNRNSHIQALVHFKHQNNNWRIQRTCYA